MSSPALSIHDYARLTEEIPEGWRWISVGDICTLTNGNAYKESDWSNKGIPIIRIQNLNDTMKPFNYWNGPLDNTVLVRDGDLLLAWSGTPGTSFGAHIWKRGLAVLNQHIFRVDLNTKDVMSEWARIAINRQLDILIGKAHGAVGLRHVTKGEVQKLRIAVPPKQVQETICTWLQSALQFVERARIAAEAQLEAAAKLAAAYLRQSFSQRVDGWITKTVAEIGVLLPSKSVSSVGDKEILVVTSACLTELGFDLSGVKKSAMRARDVSEAKLSKGEILIARSNTPELVGRAAIFNGQIEDVCASDLSIRLQIEAPNHPDFVAAYLTYLYLTGYWKEKAGGASGSMKKITRRQILALEIPLPTPTVQQNMSSELSTKFSAVKKLRDDLRERLDGVSQISNALLRRAFNGET